MTTQTFSWFEALFDVKPHASPRATVLRPVVEDWVLTRLAEHKPSQEFTGYLKANLTCREFQAGWKSSESSN
jgi:hypothetical protein